MFDHPAFDGHERILHVHDKATGLRAIIAIHSTALGPAVGGCRLWSYTADAEALADVLRLSRGMSYKNAMAGLPLGGGKSVILGPIDETRRAEFFRAFGNAVHALQGRYVTAEDVGVSVCDMEVVAERTSHVSGLKGLARAKGGDPSPYTGRGVRRGIEAAALHAFGRRDLEGLRIAVQGLGAVGMNLCRELRERGARLMVSDIALERVERACDLFGAEAVSPKEILFQEVDILAPCALGAVIDTKVANTLQSRAIAGGANNQLASPDAGVILAKRGITYAPDYVVNAGGIIKAAAEYLGSDGAGVDEAVDAIFERTLAILRAAQAAEKPSSEMADEVAKEIIDRAEAQAKAA